MHQRASNPYISLLLIASLCTLLSCSSGTGSAAGGTGSSSQLIAAKMVYGYGATGNIVQTFSATASGSVSPLSTVSVGGQGQVESVATDSNGYLYVGEDSNGVTPSTVFILQAANTTQPFAQGSFTVTGHPQVLAVDSSGQIYVGSLDGSAHVYVYPARPQGTATAVRTLNIPNVTYIADLAFDKAGNLYVAGNIQTNALNQPTTYAGVINVYPSTANGTATPLRTITSTQPVLGIAVDSTGVLYANENVPYGFNLVSFAANASGAATPTATVNLASALSQPFYSGQIRLDANGNLFTLVQTANGYLYTTYYAYPTPLTNSSKPIASFTTATAFSGPTGLAIE